MNTRQKVLIVDDKESNIIALKETLEHIDADIITAMSGNEAVGKALEFDFDLILIDVQMPGMDGFETVKYIKKEEKNRYIPILFQTGISHEEMYVIKGLECGAVDYISKPISPDILSRKVRQLLEMQRDKKELAKTKAMLQNKVNELEAIRKDLDEKNTILEKLSIEDSLTGLFNRRYFTDVLSMKLYDSNRYFWPLSMLMFDIDHFKKINDGYGHLIGDKILREIGHILKTNVRKTDYSCRYGGDEFLILFTNAKIDVSLKLSEKIQALLKSIKLQEAPDIVITISGGITENTGLISIDDFISQADNLLYKAKNYGRNQIVSFKDGNKI